MDNLERLLRQTRLYLLVLFVAGNTALITAWLIGAVILHMGTLPLLLLLAAIGLGMSLGLAYIASAYVMAPLKLLHNAILHVAPNHAHVPAPDLEKIKFGRELVTSLSLEVYQLASNIPQEAPSNSAGDPQARAIINNFPLPLFIIDKTQTIVLPMKVP